MIDLFRPAMNYPKVAEMVAEVLKPDRDGRVYCGEGPKVEEFERQLGRLLKTTAPPLALNSCTSALELALHLAGAGPGDEVISTPITCTATNGAIVRSGAQIVWADVDSTTGNIDPERVAERVSQRTRAIVAVDWAGRLCEYDALADFGLPVIQDAAHSLLAQGVHGQFVCWSFQAIKHLTTGDGGALHVPPIFRERARLLRWYGLDRLSGQDFRCQQDITEVGFKMHMNDVAAAIGLANLEIVEGVVNRHRANAEWLHRALRGISGVIPPTPDPGSAWWLYTLIVEGDRDQFVRELAERDVSSSPVHAINTKHAAYRAASTGGDSVPNADYFSAHETAIPVGWWLTDPELEQIATAVWAAARAMRPAVVA